MKHFLSFAFAAIVRCWLIVSQREPQVESVAADRATRLLFVKLILKSRNVGVCKWEWAESTAELFLDTFLSQCSASVHFHNERENEKQKKSGDVRDWLPNTFSMDFDQLKCIRLLLIVCFSSIAATLWVTQHKNFSLCSLEKSNKPRLGLPSQENSSQTASLSLYAMFDDLIIQFWGEGNESRLNLHNLIRVKSCHCALELNSECQKLSHAGKSFAFALLTHRQRKYLS